MLANVSLEDKYRIERGRVFLTGVQALARLPMLQHARDVAAGLNTAGYVSGYRGSPLSGLDTALTEARKCLEAHQIRFHPAVNEELAATAIWGTQQLHLFPQPKRDGIFAMWYGKGPGVDRCGDVFKHANFAGTARHGGVLVIAGDDHVARSSAHAHQSEHSFSACAIPVLAPAGLQDCLDFGLHGWAMSRYCGCWVAMKMTADIVESSASVAIDPQRVQVVTPPDFALPPGGLHGRWPDPPLAQERRMQQFKVYAAVAYARANGLDRLVWDAPRPRLGIIACGKAWLDVCQALHDLGIDARVARDVGLRLYKVGMAWPLEADGVRRFAEGLEEILVVEEKRQLVEYQLKEMLYNWRDDVRPRVVGKFDESGEWPAAPHTQWLLPPLGELTPALTARAIAARVARFHRSAAIDRHLALLEEKERPPDAPIAIARTPYFCSGCPHNLSTRVPQGSCALGGVGCHLMAVWMNRSTITISQMGGEGVVWLGVAEHSGTQHVFANMGDGTYYHSGLLAIRAAVAARVNITYKILYNDAVAMTGGQPVDGPLTVPRITRQLDAEGVQRIVVLADDPAKYPVGADFAPRVEIRPREQLGAVQRELRTVPGVTVLVFDQTCATEQRRRRKRGTLAQAPRRVFINELVCEGCGDCGATSNCLSVVPVVTEFGRKYAIDQFTCNVDATCIRGFCPSLVTVEGATLRRPASLPAAADADLPEPVLPALDQPYALLVAGIGGTGVVTLGALIGMAAHLEGKGVTVLDMSGIAQKGGAVLSHVRIAPTQEELFAARIATGAARAVIGCDLLVTASDEVLSKMRRGATRGVVNSAPSLTGEQVSNPDHIFPSTACQDRLSAALGERDVTFIDATRLASSLLGHSIGTNLFMLGHAWQQGFVPVSKEALYRAIELSGVAVEDNLRAFAWGRRAAADRAGTERCAHEAEYLPQTRRLSASLDEVIARRREYLVAYQDERHARRYLDLVARARAAENRVAPGSIALTEAVARNAFKLFATKDEYEVARLLSDPQFVAALRHTFDGDLRVHFHFAILGLAQVDPVSGVPRKQVYGPWMWHALRVLSKLKALRGTWFDPFGYCEERRRERARVVAYEATLGELLGALRTDNLAVAVEIAALPERLRGYGPIRERNAAAMQQRQAELIPQFHRPAEVRAKAA
jgi:indolepyruvate ferredoxin oxidoreductase